MTAGSRVGPPNLPRDPSIGTESDSPWSITYLTRLGRAGALWGLLENIKRPGRSRRRARADSAPNSPTFRSLKSHISKTAAIQLAPLANSESAR